MNKKGRARPKPWVPMRRAERMPLPQEKADYIRSLGADPEDLLLDEVWKNDRYTASVERREDGSVKTLSIKRNDRKAAHDWRHFQMIKNDIAGDEIEAVELYPAMSRLMDTSNQYWLFCAPPGVMLTVGYEHGAIVDADSEVHEIIGSVQRPLPKEWQQLR